MKKLMISIIFSLLFALCISAPGYSAAAEMTSIVDKFQKATDLQRDQMLKDLLSTDISAEGTVANVSVYDFFDIVNDIKGMYYQVATEVQKSKNNTPYQVVFLFKDKEKVKNFDKGQRIQKDGKIIRILDERLQITVWLLCGDLTDSDKALFKSDLDG
jgi:hypothetical protein